MPIFLIAGILAALFAIVLELIIGSVPDLEHLLLDSSIPPSDTVKFTALTLILFAIIEETSKLAVLWRMTIFSKETSIFPIRTLIFTIGFGGVELFLVKSMHPYVPATSIIGIFTVHLITGLLYGYTIERGYSKSKIAIALSVGILLHFAYNIFFA